MKIAILQTGHPPADLEARYGPYGEMFRHLLAAPDFDFETYAVTRGDWPAEDAFDACLVTGSSAGVYDNLPWIGPLKALLRRLAGRTPMVGICFGHQILAEALGGEVVKSPKGWAVGLHTYAIDQRQPWMDTAASISIPASHQDQVVVPPAGSVVTAASAFTSYAGLAYPAQRAISFQCHPEFAPDYAKALIEGRRGSHITDRQADAGIASLDAPNDCDRVGRWIGSFIRHG